jgi:hypothetical protein
VRDDAPLRSDQLRRGELSGLKDREPGPPRPEKPLGHAHDGDRNSLPLTRQFPSQIDSAVQMQLRTRDRSSNEHAKICVARGSSKKIEIFKRLPV